MANYDLLGNIALVKFDKNLSQKQKKIWAEEFLKNHKQIKTVLEKTQKIKGRLRTPKTKYIAGEKTKIATYKENSCTFTFHIEKCYFSPRLSTERKELALLTKKNERVLVMFGGVAPYAIVIAKLAKPKEIFSVELGRECSKFAKKNVEINKTPNVKIIQGDVKKQIPKIKGYFDRIIMARPNLKDDFLDVAFPKIKKGWIHYYGFYDENKKQELLKLIKEKAKQNHKKIKIKKIKKAGDIGVRKYRWRVDFQITE